MANPFHLYISMVCEEQQEKKPIQPMINSTPMENWQLREEEGGKQECLILEHDHKQGESIVINLKITHNGRNVAIKFTHTLLTNAPRHTMAQRSCIGKNFSLKMIHLRVPHFQS